MIVDSNDMPFAGQVVPTVLRAEVIDSFLDALGMGDDSHDVSSFTYESLDGDEAETPNCVGAFTVSMYRQGIQFTATIPVVDTDE